MIRHAQKGRQSVVVGTYCVFIPKNERCQAVQWGSADSNAKTPTGTVQNTNTPYNANPTVLRGIGVFDSLLSARTLDVTRTPALAFTYKLLLCVTSTLHTRLHADRTQEQEQFHRTEVVVAEHHCCFFGTHKKKFLPRTD